MKRAPSGKMSLQRQRLLGHTVLVLCLRPDRGGRHRRERAQDSKVPLDLPYWMRLRPLRGPFWCVSRGSRVALKNSVLLAQGGARGWSQLIGFTFFWRWAHVVTRLRGCVCQGAAVRGALRLDINRDEDGPLGVFYLSCIYFKEAPDETIYY